MPHYHNFTPSQLAIRTKATFAVHLAFYHARGCFSTISPPAASLLQSFLTSPAHDRRLPSPVLESPDIAYPNSPATIAAVVTPTETGTRPASPTSSTITLIDPQPRKRHKLETSSSTTSFQTVSARLERYSRLCTRPVVCVTCKKVGIDFPSCAKCGDMWCSRQCRLSDGQKRHSCRPFSRRQSLPST